MNIKDLKYIKDASEFALEYLQPVEDAHFSDRFNYFSNIIEVVEKEITLISEVNKIIAAEEEYFKSLLEDADVQSIEYFKAEHENEVNKLKALLLDKILSNRPTDYEAIACCPNSLNQE